jgi:zinc protease
MALVAVGDIDPDAVEAAIQSSFADIPRSAQLPPLPVYEIPAHPETLVSVATDPEARGSAVSLIFKHPRLEEKTVGDYRKDLVQALFHSMVNDRSPRWPGGATRPSSGASSSGGALGPTVDTYALSAARGRRRHRGRPPRPRDGSRARCAATGSRPRRWSGPRSPCWPPTSAASSSATRRRAGPTPASTSSYFLDAEPSPGIETEYRLVQQLLPGISLEEVRAT